MEARVHLKGLNGLRAIAALAVVLSHTSGGIGTTDLRDVLPVGLATYSVTIFFTLSGFLITYLLFKEKEKQEISIRNFYVRRILRIWPLYFTYLAIALVVISFQDRAKLPGSTAYYVFFIANILTVTYNHLPHLSHYWTLGVEEQFYVFWPWIVKRSNNVLKGLIIFTIAFYVLKLFARLLYEEGNIYPLHFLSTTRFGCMSMGGIAALLCIQRHRLFFMLTTHKFTEIACWLGIVAIAFNKYFIFPFVNHEIVAIVTICIIVNLSFNKKAIIDLENRVFDLLGRISFGMYIIHPLVILCFQLLSARLHWAREWKYLFFYTGVFFFVILIAWLSYELFEKKFLELKDKFSVVKSSG